MTSNPNSEKKDHPAGSPDKLVETGPEASIELSEGELNDVSGGGTANTFLKIDGIKGESQDDKHKSEINISSF